jgi:hypothetical protein
MNLPGITLPGITLPRMNLPGITLPRMNLRWITLPGITGLSIRRALAVTHARTHSETSG